MLLDVDGRLGMKIELTQIFQVNSLIPYEHHHNQNYHAYAHSSQMFQSNLQFGF